VVLLVEFDGPLVGGDGFDQLLLAMKDNGNLEVDPGGSSSRRGLNGPESSSGRQLVS
jgi:hypothetical protein